MSIIVYFKLGQNSGCLTQIHFIHTEATCGVALNCQGRDLGLAFTGLKNGAAVCVSSQPFPHS